MRGSRGHCLTLCNLASLAMAAHRYGAVFPLLHRVLQSNRDHTDALMLLGDAYFATERFSSAIIHFRKYLEAQPTHARAGKGLIASTEQLDLRLDPDYAAAANRRGMLMTRSGKHAPAMTLCLLFFGARDS